MEVLNQIFQMGKGLPRFPTKFSLQSSCVVTERTGLRYGYMSGLCGQLQGKVGCEPDSQGSKEEVKSRAIWRKEGFQVRSTTLYTR